MGGGRAAQRAVLGALTKLTPVTWVTKLRSRVQKKIETDFQVLWYA